jgi:hypothetical protein
MNDSTVRVERLDVSQDNKQQDKPAKPNKVDNNYHELNDE